MDEIVTKSMKPRMPEGLNIIAEGKLECRLLSDFSKYRNGHILMTYGGGDIVDDEKEIGRIAADIGNTSLMVTIGEASYQVKYLDIFKLVLDAHNKAEKQS